jgi:hypothetical protein
VRRIERWPSAIMTAADMNIKIDLVTRNRVIDGAVANLNEYYVFPETAKKMVEVLRARPITSKRSVTTSTCE